MNRTIPAPTIVPTKAVVNSGIAGEMFPTACIKVGTRLTAITTAMMAVMNPVTYPFTSAIEFNRKSLNKNEHIRISDIS